MRVTPERRRTAPSSQRRRWPGAGRAAVLFVGVPLTAALVLAATPLSEPPVASPPAVAALPSAAAKPAATHAPDAALGALDAEPRVSRVALERDCDEVVRRVLGARRSNAPRPVVVPARPVIAGPAPRIVPASRLVTVAHVVGRPLAPPSAAAASKSRRLDIGGPDMAPPTPPALVTPRRRCYAWLGPALSSKRTGVLPRR